MGVRADGLVFDEEEDLGPGIPDDEWDEKYSCRHDRESQFPRDQLPTHRKSFVYAHGLFDWELLARETPSAKWREAAEMAHGPDCENNFRDNFSTTSIKISQGKREELRLPL